MGILSWEIFKVSEDKPHRKGNDCKRIKSDLVQCMKQTPCWKSGAMFEECMQSKDPAWVSGGATLPGLGYLSDSSSEITALAATSKMLGRPAVAKECMHLRDAYMQCRKCLIVPNLRLYGNPFS
ncbi:Origin recognition complex, subunit 1 [Perkinsus chesapeaki]|uniref:Origin recognition complex, subunit 1 n=1 Tax=Perkinsus chesapeaki TaxID=330153 RepID=A0A7J6LY48_PERCH|nr:Origin recognition complex, subunit 1 [Perkinsus chesapeaki]